MLVLSFHMFLQVLENDIADISKRILGVIVSVATHKHDLLISSYLF